MIAKMRRKRKYEEQVETSVFKNYKPEKFEKLFDYKDTEFKDKGDIDDSHIFYSWECVSFLRENGTSLDLVV